MTTTTATTSTNTGPGDPSAKTDRQAGAPNTQQSPETPVPTTGTIGQTERTLVRLAAVVDRLSAQVADRLTPPNLTAPGHAPAHTAAAAAEVVQVSWLALPADPMAAQALLDGLVGWLGQVFLRYTDAVRAVPECWLWHPDVIEELLWCQQTWLRAYGPEGSPARVGEWHTVHRPGVVARVKTLGGMCSIETHQPNRVPARPVVVPFADSAPVIAGWWGTRRDQPAPHAPTPVCGHEQGRTR